MAHDAPGQVPTTEAHRSVGELANKMGQWRSAGLDRCAPETGIWRRGMEALYVLILMLNFSVVAIPNFHSRDRCEFAGASFVVEAKTRGERFPRFFCFAAPTG